MTRKLCGLLILAATTVNPGFGQKTIAITNVTIIDGTDGPPRGNSRVVVKGEKILAIAANSEELPKNATLVDGAGKFLIPGLWNNDLHGPAYDEAKTSLASLVSYGVTTVRDMGAPLDDITELRTATASGALVGPPCSLPVL